MEGSDGRRKSGLRGMLQKAKGAIRRRHGQNAGDDVMVPQATVGTENISSAPRTCVVANGESPALPEQNVVTMMNGDGAQNALETSTIVQPRATATTTADDFEVLDDNELDNRPGSSNGESLLPMHPTRTRFTQERARAMFEKHGVAYEPVTGSMMSRDGPQRVEKPIRLRMHWQCHECHIQFGTSRTCVGCGHRRCDDCSRGPAKRVRETLAAAATDQQRQESGMASDPTEGTAPVVIAEEDIITPQNGSTTQTRGMAVLEARSAEDMAADDSDEPSDRISLLLRSQRPLSAIDLISDLTDSTLRRTCHECRTAISPAHTPTCQHCRHRICPSCSREPTRQDQWAYSGASPGQEVSKMVASVQRVYRKPRQRIRWNCSECNAVFVDKKTCRACGHEKCADCTRTPAKRVVTTPDPAVLQSVSDRLAHLSVQQPAN